jgi:hypothetical protein
MYGQADDSLAGVGTSFDALSEDIFSTYLPKIQQGTDIAFSGNKGIKILIETALESIDDQFAITLENGIDTMEGIQSATNDAVDDIAKHLTQYEVDTKEAVEAAGNSIDDFIDDSVEDARSVTQGLNDDTNDFKITLTSLKLEITKTMTELDR